VKDAAAIFRFLVAAIARGERTALITLTEVIGSSPRAIGTHMAVAESGAYIGSFSGGCVEAAIVGEAKRVIVSGRAETVRFRAGSRYLDVRLPCGGGIDVLIIPDPAHHICECIVAKLEARHALTLALATTGGLSLLCNAAETGWYGERFQVRHDPQLRLVIVGHGEECMAVARLAKAYGADLQILTPDRAVKQEAELIGIRALLLKTPSPSADLIIDPYCAVIFLFHDHDWEPNLIAQVLAQKPFYVGAMGSPGTQEKRLKVLGTIGMSASLLANVRGPIGLIAATRDPETLALSVLAEVVKEYIDFCSKAFGNQFDSKEFHYHS
jgi:xanthine dehydrogenase accessory factor